MFKSIFEKFRTKRALDGDEEEQDPYPDTSEMGYLQRGIERRVRELHALAAYTSRKGSRLTWWSNSIKVTTITLGAISAAKATFGSSLGIPDHTLSLVFTTFAVVISVTTGFEAAFRLDRRGTGLTSLASDSLSAARSMDSEWRKKIGSVQVEKDQQTAAKQLLGELDKKLHEYSSAASRFGVCYAYEIYSGRNEYVKKIHRQHAA